MQRGVERFSNTSRSARIRATRLCLFLAGAVLVTGTARAEPAQSLPLQVLPGYAVESFTGDLPAMRERKVIRALVTPSKTDFFIVAGRPRGLQAELLQQYEKELNRGNRRGELPLRVVFIPVAFSELIPSLLAGTGDVAAAMLTVTPAREAQVAFASGRGMSVEELVVARKGADHPATLDELSGRSLYVLRGSSYVEHLRALSRRLRRRGLAPIDIEEADANLRSEDILELVNAGVVDLTVVDDYKAKLWARVLAEIRVLEGLKVHTGGHLGWAVRQENPELRASLQRFLKKVRKGSLTGNVLWKRYFETVEWIRNPVEEEEQSRLGRYVDLFRKYGERYGFDYRALAAQAYQESRLDPARRSLRGAIGLMQVLPSTAADPNVGISDIEEVENNVHAGAKYLAFLRDRYFADEDIEAADRLALAWAAYNAGPARVQQMRTATAKMGLDPNRWFQNVEYATLKHTGREPVRYVANVYKYYVAYRLKGEFLSALNAQAGL